MKKASFKIEGMTCASCAMTVKKTVAHLAGVETVAVNIATEKMSLTYHEEHISWKDIATAIEKAGYHLLTDRKIETYLINDMTCASCAMAVEKALSNIEGIEEVVVNLATEKARVSYLGNLLTSQEICQSIEKAGYAASLVDKKSQQIEHREHDRQNRSSSSLYLVSYLYTCPFVYCYGTDGVWKRVSIAKLASFSPSLYSKSALFTPACLIQWS